MLISIELVRRFNDYKRLEKENDSLNEYIKQIKNGI